MGRTKVKANGRALRAAAALAVLASGAAGQDSRPGSFNLYGTPGLIDMPTAEAAPDGTFSSTVSNLGDITRTTLTFQITPHMSGSFRYSALANYASPASVDGTYYDRSFDLRYQLVREGKYRPGVAIGLQDLIGTGLSGAEYIVATKAVSPTLRFTGGLGWGRLGSADSFASTGTRPTTLLGSGGIPTYDRWFRGPVSAFGGLAWSPRTDLTFKAEYSTDAYVEEVANGRFERKSPWNFGLDYRTKRGHQLSAYYAYGSEFGVQMTFHTGLTQSPIPGGREVAPQPVAVRARADIADLGWTSEPDHKAVISASLSKAMARDNLVFEGLTIEPRRAVLRLRNSTYNSSAQAIGRTARIMSRMLPSSVEELVIVPMVNGMAMSGVVLKRSDVERLENAAAEELLARTAVVDAHRLAPPVDGGHYPRFLWSFSPYITISAFDPDNPIRADAGLRASASYRIAPNIVLSGSVTKKIGGNLNEIERVGTSALPPVRTNYREYARQGDPAIEKLTLAVYGRPGKDLYSRFTVGYLENQYGGVSGELLWKPVDSRLGLGVELNYVKQREFKQMFGFRDYEILTGHASAYYDFGNGFHGQLDVGRYLAGDYGATIALDREFGNGWRVGAYATFTDVPFDDFGEGSFDKGIRITMPLSWALGTPTRRENNIVIQSLTRDGGARVNVDGRLYDQVRDYHRPELENSWGRFWR